MCPATVNSGMPACDTCMTTACCAQVTACLFDAECNALSSCLYKCAVGDQACIDACTSTHPAGASLLNSANDCENTTCSAACKNGD
jgi:hypothetical protein